MIAKLCFLLGIFLFAGWAFAGKKDKPPMSIGEKLYRANCASCHKLIPPHRYSSEQWPVLLKKFVPRTKLTPEATEKILAYLLQGANK